MDFYYSVEKVFEIYMRTVWMVFFLGQTAFRMSIPSIQSLSLYILLASIAMYAIKVVRDNDMNIPDVLIPRFTFVYSFFVLYVVLSKRYGVLVKNSNDIMIQICKFDFLAVLAMDIFIISREKLEELLKLYLISMTTAACYLTLITPVSLWGNELGYASKVGIHRNAASVFYVVAFGIALYFIKETKRRAYYGIAVILFFANIITGSRKGIIQIFFSLGIFILLQGKIKLKSKYVLYMILCLIIIVLAYIYIPWVRDTFGERMLALFDDSIEDSSKTNRKLFRTIAFYAFLDYPVFGYGYEAFTMINEIVTGHGVYSHCNYTELLCNYGIIGFSLYYINYVFAIIKSVAFWKDPIAKMVICTVIPLILIEYGQINYTYCYTVYAVMIALLSAKVLTPRFQGV